MMLPDMSGYVGDEDVETTDDKVQALLAHVLEFDGVESGLVIPEYVPLIDGRILVTLQVWLEG